MAISDLLMSQKRWGRARCRRLLLSIGVPENKKIGTLDRAAAPGARGGTDGEGDGPLQPPSRSDCETGGWLPLTRSPPPDATRSGVSAASAGHPGVARAGHPDVPARRCARRGRAGRPTSRSSARAPRCRRRPATRGSPARRAAPPRTRPRARSGGWSRRPPCPARARGYSRQVTSVPGRPSSSPKTRWRASGSSSFTPCSTSLMPEQVAVEGDRLLGVPDDQGDVVDAGDPEPSGLFHVCREATATAAGGRSRQADVGRVPGLPAHGRDNASGRRELR